MAGGELIDTQFGNPAVTISPAINKKPETNQKVLATDIPEIVTGIGLNFCMLCDPLTRSTRLLLRLPLSENSNSIAASCQRATVSN